MVEVNRCFTYSTQTFGRNYLTDRYKYRRKYRELLSYYKDAEPNRMDISKLPCEEWQNSEGIILGQAEGRLIKRDSSGEGNLLIIGPPGKGKTSRVCIPTALRFNAFFGGGGVFAIDLKQDIYNAIKDKRRVKLFDPMDSGGLHFSPFRDVPRMVENYKNNTRLKGELRMFLTQMAYNLVPTDTGTNGQYFSAGARAFFRGIAMYYLVDDPFMTFPDLISRILNDGNAQEFIDIVKECDVEAAKIILKPKDDSNPNNVGGCFENLTDALEQFYDYMDVLDGKGDCISPEDLISGYDICVAVHQDFKTALSPICSMVAQDVMRFFMQRPDKTTGLNNNHALILLDEFGVQNYSYEYIADAAASLRSKNCSLALAVQSLFQIDQKYGINGRRAIIGCINTFVLMGGVDEDAVFMSKLLGKKRVLKLTNTYGGEKGSISITEDREDVIPPENWANLGSKIVIHHNGQYVIADKVTPLHELKETPDDIVYNCDNSEISYEEFLA